MSVGHGRNDGGDRVEERVGHRDGLPGRLEAAEEGGVPARGGVDEVADGAAGLPGWVDVQPGHVLPVAERVEDAVLVLVAAGGRGREWGEGGGDSFCVAQGVH